MACAKSYPIRSTAQTGNAVDEFISGLTPSARARVMRINGARARGPSGRGIRVGVFDSTTVFPKWEHFACLAVNPVRNYEGNLEKVVE